MDFSEVCGRIITQSSRDIAQKYKNKYIESDHILFALCIDDRCAASRVFDAFGAKKDILDLLYLQFQHYATNSGLRSDLKPEHSQSIKLLIAKAKKFARELGSETIRTDHLLLALCDGDENTLSTSLDSSAGYDIEMFKEHIKIKGDSYAQLEQSVYVSKASAKQKLSSIDRYMIDITDACQRSRIDPVIDRRSYTDQMKRILSRRNKNSLILVGPTGVGKRSLVYALATAIISGDVPPSLTGKRIVSINQNTITEGMLMKGDLQARVQKMVDEIMTDGSIIVFIEDIHSYISSSSPRSTQLLSALKPLLTGSKVLCIGATTPLEYKKYLENDSLVARDFEIINVVEPSEEETFEMANLVRPYYESFHNVRVSKESIKQIIELSGRYIGNGVLPEKAMSLLDEVCASATMTHQHEGLKWSGSNADDKVIRVGKEDVNSVVAAKTGIPLGDLKRSDADRLINMEEDLHKYIVGQNRGVRAISACVRRSRSGLIDRKRPIGSFAFLGPTGVGKSYFAKVLAQQLFGKASALMRFDMSDYMDRHSSSKLVGTAPGYIGYEDGGVLIERVRANPYAVILFDEIEKAHPDIFNLLLQILEEGELQDKHGHAISFKNTIIIMTSNIGYKARSTEEAKQEFMRHFRPEFVNRIDEVILFDQLTRFDVGAIFDHLIEEINTSLAEKHIHISFDPSARDYLIERGYDPEMGARPLRRVLQRSVEDPLAMEFLAGRLPSPGLVDFFMGEDNKLCMRAREDETRTPEGDS